MSTLELRTQRNALIQEMHDLTEGNSFPAEAQRRWKDLDNQQKQLETRIRKEETSSLQDEMRRVSAPSQPQPTGDFEQYRRGAAPPPQTHYSETRELRPFLSDLESRDYTDAFDSYLRRGEQSLTAEQRNLLVGVSNEIRNYSGLTTATGGDAAGFTIPVGFQRELEVAMKAVGRIRANSRVLNTPTGNVLDWPTMDDTNNVGEIVAEANPVSQLNPPFSQIQFTSFLFSSKQVLLSVQLAQDSAFNLQEVLAEAFGTRLGRSTNSYYTNGSGTGEPEGLVTAIKNDAVPNIVNATGSSSNDGDTGHTEANSIGSDDLDNLIGAVDPMYRPGGKFMMNWTTLDYLRKLKDRYGRPLWASGLSANQPDTIWGFPYDWNADMDAIGAGKYPVLFGDFSKFVVRDAGPFTLVVYRELYMPNHQIGYQAWLRTDSRRLQPRAFSLLKNPLS